jgi:hypothetical protein
MVWSDAVTFTELTATDDVTQWATAVALIRGPFLSGFFLPNNVEYDA